MAQVFVRIPSVHEYYEPTTVEVKFDKLPPTWDVVLDNVFQQEKNALKALGQSRSTIRLIGPDGPLKGQFNPHLCGTSGAPLILDLLLQPNTYTADFIEKPYFSRIESAISYESTHPTFAARVNQLQVPTLEDRQSTQYRRDRSDDSSDDDHVIKPYFIDPSPKPNRSTAQLESDQHGSSTRGPTPSVLLLPVAAGSGLGGMVDSFRSPFAGRSEGVGGRGDPTHIDMSMPGQRQRHILSESITRRSDRTGPPGGRRNSLADFIARFRDMAPFSSSSTRAELTADEDIVELHPLFYFTTPMGRVYHTRIGCYGATVRHPWPPPQRLSPCLVCTPRR